MTLPIAIVGAGISGLSAAFELTRRGVAFSLFERAPRFGGVVITEQIGGYTIDAGPDALLTQKPAATALCAELGLGSSLQGQLTRRTYVMRGRRLRLLPPTSVFGLPTRWLPFVTTDAFSWRAKIRMAAEIAIPPRRDDVDESIASFIGRRFGQSAVDDLAEPLLAGIHGGDPARLSMRAGFPRLVDLEARHGSVIAGLRGMKNDSSVSPFVSLPQGMEALTAAIVRALPAPSLIPGISVESVQRCQAGYTLHLSDGMAVNASSVIFCTPPAVTARLAGGFDRDLQALCARIQSTSAVTVALGYRRSAVRHPLNGTGFVAPRREACGVRAVSWVSSKWAHRAPDGCVLLRAYVGGAADPGAIDRSDQSIAQAVQRDLTRILHIVGDPDLIRIYRWPKATPQIEVGHGRLLDQIEARLTVNPGVFVSASGFRGTGIPDCVADGRRQAGAALSALSTALSA